MTDYNMYKMKTIDIKGTPYVMVHERLKYLANSGKPYSLLSEAKYMPDLKGWHVIATLTYNKAEYMGNAFESIGDGFINKTSALENAETSAWGRACAAAGIGIDHAIASADEVKSATLTKDQRIRLIDAIDNCENIDSLSELEKYCLDAPSQDAYNKRLRELS